MGGERMRALNRHEFGSTGSRRRESFPKKASANSDYGWRAAWVDVAPPDRSVTYAQKAGMVAHETLAVGDGSKVPNITQGARGNPLVCHNIDTFRRARINPSNRNNNLLKYIVFSQTRTSAPNCSRVLRCRRYFHYFQEVREIALSLP